MSEDVGGATVAASHVKELSPNLSGERDYLADLGVGDTERVFSVAFHPTKQYLAIGCENSSIKLWNIRTKLYMSIVTQPGRIQALRFSHDGTFLCSAASGHSEGNTLALWACVHDVKNDEEMSLRLYMYDTQLAPGRMEVLHQGDINSIAFAPNRGKQGPVLVASGSSDTTVRLWHYPQNFRMSRQTLRNHSNAVTAVDFTSDGKVRYNIDEYIDDIYR